MLFAHHVEMLGGTLLFASFIHYLFGITMTLTAIFLILLVLVQRGRGGGLAGAFGGMGGQSAFGTKAGDAFTKVTIGVSIFWILLCIASVKLMGTSAGSFGKATSPIETQFVPGADGSTPALPDELLGDSGSSDRSESSGEGFAAPQDVTPSQDTTPSPDTTGPLDGASPQEDGAPTGN